MNIQIKSYSPDLGSAKALIHQFDQKCLSESSPHWVDYFLGTTLLDSLTQLINQHIELVPPYCSVTKDQVDLILKTDNLWAIHYPSDDIPLIDRRIDLAVSGNQVIAAAQSNILKKHSSEGENRSEFINYIPWIFSSPANQDGAKLLLDHIIHQSLKLKCATIEITERFSFGIGWFGIPKIWEHVITALETAHFIPTKKWILMSTQLPKIRPDRLQAVDIPSDLKTNWKISEANLDWVLEICKGDTVIGESQVWGIPPHLSKSDGIQKWAMLEWLGVADLYKRQKIGSYLVQEQLRFQAQRNIQNLLLTTEYDNKAARDFLERQKFTYGSECWCFAKLLP